MTHLDHRPARPAGRPAPQEPGADRGGDRAEGLAAKEARRTAGRPDRAGVACLPSPLCRLCASSAGPSGRGRTSREVLTVGRYTFAEVARVGHGPSAGRAGGVRRRRQRSRRHLPALQPARPLPRDRARTPWSRSATSRSRASPWRSARPTDRLYVLLRPPGDRRHVEPGWWETFDFQRQAGRRRRSGSASIPTTWRSRPTAATPSSSPRAGPRETPRSPPRRSTFSRRLIRSKPIGHVSFDGPGDDPARLTLSATGRCAAVTLLGSKTVAAVELVDPSAPRVIGRTPLARTRAAVSVADDG